MGDGFVGLEGVEVEADGVGDEEVGGGGVGGGVEPEDGMVPVGLVVVGGVEVDFDEGARGGGVEDEGAHLAVVAEEEAGEVLDGVGHKLFFAEWAEWIGWVVAVFVFHGQPGAEGGVNRENGRVFAEAPHIFAVIGFVGETVRAVAAEGGVHGCWLHSQWRGQ